MGGMTGRELYELYQAQLANYHVGTDDFDQIEPTDQRAWSDLAEVLNGRFTNGS